MPTGDMWGRWLTWGSGLSITAHWGVVGEGYTGADMLCLILVLTPQPHALLLSKNGEGSSLSVILTIQRKFEKQVLYKMSQFFLSWQFLLQKTEQDKKNIVQA